MSKIPFDKDVPIASLYRNEQFLDNIARLEYAATRQQFSLLTGPVGCGKSTLLRALTNCLDASKYEIIYISDSRLTPRWLYNKMLEQMGMKGFFYRGDGKKAVHEQFAIMNGIRGKDIVCIIDESHLLFRETFEELRFFLNWQMDSKTMVTLILAGQKELDEKLKSPLYEAIRQRIRIVCSLEPYTRDQTERYIESHLKFSGTELKDIFSTEAIDVIYRHSGGIPRLINLFATQTLTGASMRQLTKIDADLVTSVIKTETLFD